jgi:hypothetical protein
MESWNEECQQQVRSDVTAIKARLCIEQEETDFPSVLLFKFLQPTAYHSLSVYSVLNTFFVFIVTSALVRKLLLRRP